MQQLEERRKRKKKKKSKTSNKLLKDLMLDKPTSHGGWPEGENRGWLPGSKPVNQQIGDYLTSMGLAEGHLRQLIRVTLEEALSPNLPKRYHRYRAGMDDEMIKNLESMESSTSEDSLQAHELATTLGSEEPYSIDVSVMSGISSRDLDAIIYDAVNDVIHDEFWGNDFHPVRSKWEHIHDHFWQPEVLDKMANDVIDQALKESLRVWPGNSQVRRLHIRQHGQDPEHYAKLTHEMLKEEIEEYYKMLRYGWM